MSTNHLRYVLIRVNVEQDWLGMKPCLQSLVDGDRLTKFSLHPISLHDPLGVLQGSTLQSLTRIRSMRKFSIIVPCSMTYHDVTAFAKAWPNLESIRFSHPVSPPVHRGFDALIVLAKCCPHLDHIELCLDLSDAPTPEEIPYLNHSLPRLDLTLLHLSGIASNDEQVRKIAGAIQRLFLKIFTWFHPFEADEGWSKVLAIVKELRNPPNQPKPTS